MRGKRSLSLVMFTVLVLVAPVAVWGQESVTTIDYPGADLTIVTGINPKGDIVGYYHIPGTPGSETHGFFLDRDGFVTIDYPQATTGAALDINPAGDIVGAYRKSDGAQHGYLLRRGRFTTINVPGATFTGAYGINAAGDITGHFGVPNSGKMNVFLLRHGRFTTYVHPDAVAGMRMTCAFGIGHDDQIVGHYVDGLGMHGFLLNEGVFTTIDVPGGKNADAQGINPEGEIVGLYTEIGTGTATVPAKIHGFVMDKWGVFTQIDVPGAVNTWIRGNNPRGDLVGEYTTTVIVGTLTTTTTHGFLMTAR